jgi:ABC-2 type transport system permease protein
LSSQHSQIDLTATGVARAAAPGAKLSEIESSPPPARSTFFLPTVSLWWREIVRFYRQPSRWIGVLLSPLIFWLVIGSGLGKSFNAGGALNGGGYLEYFFPGTLILILLFTSIFCMMSVIEDRREGFLSSVLVSPAPRASLVMGKLLGGSSLAVLQGFLFLLLAPVVGLSLDPLHALTTLGIMFLISFGLTGLGFCIAWQLDSTHGFHALINLLLLPMWLLSGALFPLSGASSWVGWLMRANPLTYNVVALRGSLYNSGTQTIDEVTSFPIALGITVGFSVLMFLVALWTASRKQRRARIN